MYEAPPDDARRRGNAGLENKRVLNDEVVRARLQGDTCGRSLKTLDKVHFPGPRYSLATLLPRLVFAGIQVTMGGMSSCHLCKPEGCLDLHASLSALLASVHIASSCCMLVFSHGEETRCLWLGLEIWIFPGITQKRHLRKCSLVWGLL